MRVTKLANEGYHVYANALQIVINKDKTVWHFNEDGQHWINNYNEGQNFDPFFIKQRLPEDAEAYLYCLLGLKSFWNAEVK